MGFKTKEPTQIEIKKTLVISQDAQEQLVCLRKLPAAALANSTNPGTIFFTAGWGPTVDGVEVCTEVVHSFLLISRRLLASNFILVDPKRPH